MKVSELIEKLQQVRQDAEVWTEGCDCDGDCAFVVVQDDGDILLARSDAYYARKPYGRQV
jgi:hypothetical protein